MQPRLPAFGRTLGSHLRDAGVTPSIRGERRGHTFASRHLRGRRAGGRRGHTFVPGGTPGSHLRFTGGDLVRPRTLGSHLRSASATPGSHLRFAGVRFLGSHLRFGRSGDAGVTPSIRLRGTPVRHRVTPSIPFGSRRGHAIGVTPSLRVRGRPGHRGSHLRSSFDHPASLKRSF